MRNFFQDLYHERHPDSYFYTKPLKNPIEHPTEPDHLGINWEHKNLN